MTEGTRDDLLTGIHKALRLGLLRGTVQLGATDWANRADCEAAAAEWRHLCDLLRSHSGHEERHILPLLESKRPHALADIHADHEELDASLDQLDDAIASAADSGDTRAGQQAYALAARFTGRYVEHLTQEDRTVMPGIWAACSDEEIAACRAAFMAEIAPDEAAYTQELMLPALSTTERVAVLRGARRHLPPPAYHQLLALAERVLGPERWQRTSAHLHAA